MSAEERESIQRHESLQDLSRDHHRVLVLSQEIQHSLEPAEDASETDQENEQPSPSEMADEMIHFWEKEGRYHFREEEEAILPVYLRSVKLTEDESLVQVLTDHAWIRDAVQRLADKLERGESFDDLLKHIAEKLNDHARLEERTFFQRVQEELTEEELDEIGRRSRRYREEVDLPIGPG